MFSKSLIPFSVDGWGCIPSLLLDLRSYYGGGNEDNGDLLQKVPCKHCYIQCPESCSRPQSTHASVGDSWTFMGKSGSKMSFTISRVTSDQLGNLRRKKVPYS